MKTPEKRFRREMISFVVSAYDRPVSLRASLASIAAQTEPHEMIVCCNHKDKDLIDEQRAIAKYFGARFETTGLQGAYCCYSSAELVIEKQIPKGEWLCFASDDSLYMAGFADILMREARENRWDLVYCDMVYDRMIDGKPWGYGMPVRYNVLDVKPIVNNIDKTGFLVRATWFNGFPGKRRGGPTASDGLFIEDCVARGIRHGKAPGVLVVHQ